jgi:DNA-binding CsgD family transcriptional regulator
MGARELDHGRTRELVMDLSGDLLERGDAVASVSQLITGLAAGSPGALFLLAEAGLGKTSVLDHACRLAASAGLTTGVGRGHPMETNLPFGLLTQALEDAGAHGVLGADHPSSSGPEDRAAQFYGVLRWLRDRTGTGLLLALDDLHWADADSLALICFLCRRISPLRLGLVASLRPWPPQAGEAVADLVAAGHGSIQRLIPLSRAAAGSLLAARLGRALPAEASQRAFTLSAGNPLLLEQLAVALGGGAALPATAELSDAAFAQGVLLGRFAGLPPAGMRCAQAASVLGASFLPEVAAQVAGLADEEAAAALESLGRTGLIDQPPGGGADFTHPLFRQALYDDLAGPARTRLHARAFAVLHARGLDAQAAEHAVQANLAGDPEAVAVLERAGRAARRAGALATAVTRLDAAVAMAGDLAGVGLLLAQAEALLVGGHPDRAVAAYDGLLSRPDFPAGARAEALWMLGRALVMTGDHDRAAAVFGRSADVAEADDPGAAVSVLLDAAFCSWMTYGPVRALPYASRARNLAGLLGDEQVIRAADAGWGVSALQAGDPAGMTAAEPAAPWLDSGWSADRISRDGWGLVNSFGHCAMLVERLAEADRAFAAIRAVTDVSNAPDAIAMLANVHGYALARMGRLDEAVESINVALSLVDLVPLIDSFAGVGRAHLLLYMGQMEESAQWCKRVEATATARGEWNALLFVWDVLGHRRLREGAITEACEHYERLEAMVSRMGIGEPCLPPWGRHAIGAYLAAGRTADAERVLSWLERAAGPLPCRFPRIAAATGRAQLAELHGDAAGAEAHFLAALALHEQVSLPLEHAETLLAYGGFLRRSGRPAAARPVLAEATEVAQAAGAGWLAGLARDELKVAGGRRHHRPPPGTLTAQEERVAALAASGARNADIARQLYLSVSTVETHLQRVYAKLGIHSRRELTAVARDARWGPRR